MLKVLGTTADSSLGDILDQPLCTLCHIPSGLQASVSAGGTRPCLWVLSMRPLTPGLPPLLAALAPGGPEEGILWGCLKASIMFNLFCFIARDLTCRQ
ncbi:Interferon Lambda-3 [Manis pentadactyla]|nr:Interferon Lambda-3 [Manis pentadactyla]